MDDDVAPVARVVAFARRWWPVALLLTMLFHQYMHMWDHCRHEMISARPRAEACENKETFATFKDDCTAAIIVSNSSPAFRAFIELASGHHLWSAFVDMLGTWTGVVLAMLLLLAAVSMLRPLAARLPGPLRWLLALLGLAPEHAPAGPSVAIDFQSLMNGAVNFAQQQQHVD